jgi:hypothetical protein
VSSWCSKLDLAHCESGGEECFPKDQVHQRRLVSAGKRDLDLLTSHLIKSQSASVLTLWQSCRQGGLLLCLYLLGYILFKLWLLDALELCWDCCLRKAKKKISEIVVLTQNEALIGILHVVYDTDEGYYILT